MARKVSEEQIETIFSSKTDANAKKIFLLDHIVFHTAVNSSILKTLHLRKHDNLSDTKRAI